MTSRRLPAKTLVDVLGHHARTRANSVVFEFEGRTTTFRRLEEESNRLARRIAAAGIVTGDRVVWLGKNSDHFFTVMFAAMKLGAVIVPIGWRLAPAEVTYIVQDAEPSLVVIGLERGASATAVEAVAGGAQILRVEDGSYERWFEDEIAAPPLHVSRPDDLAVQLYTSGTTGKPKGAMLTQGSFVTHLGNMVDADVHWNRWSADDVSYLPMPLSHIGGTGWGIWGIYHGAHTIIGRRFEIDAAFECIEQKGITKLFVVPSALQLMVRHPRARQIDYSRIRHMNYGASPISPALLRECIEVFGCGFTQMYGMTETIGTVVALPPEDHTAPGTPKIRAAGVPLPGVEIAIFDQCGRICASHEIGEVAIRSVARMAGYWRLPEATATTIDAEGWLHTGDAGYLDEDGYLFIHDRIKDMIVSGGENVYSVEVEAVLADHPDVADVAVIGVPSDKWGEEVAAFIVLRDGRSASEEQLQDFARSRLAGFKIPRVIRFIDELPRNPSAKVLKRELRAPFWASQERQVS